MRGKKVLLAAALLLLAACGRSNRDMDGLSNEEKAVYCMYYGGGFLMKNDANGLPVLSTSGDPEVRTKGLAFLGKVTPALQARGGSEREFAQAMALGRMYANRMEPQAHARLGSRGLAAGKMAMDGGDVDGAADTMMECIAAYKRISG